MKRFFILLLAAALILTLFACGEKKEPDATGTDTASGLSTETAEQTGAETGSDTVPAQDTDLVPDGDAVPEGIPDASDHTVEHTVKYYSPDGKLIWEETVPATDHVWKFESDAEGHRAVCTLCGASGESGAHDYDGAGVCRVCGYGCEHVFTDTVTAPGCTEPGYTLHTCSKCGFKYSSDPVPAAGHKYEKSVEAPATCDENGSFRYTCSVCGMSVVMKNAIPATGHNYVNGVCTVCGESDSEIPIISDDGDETGGDEPTPFWGGGEYELPEIPIG